MAGIRYEREGGVTTKCERGKTRTRCERARGGMEPDASERGGMRTRGKREGEGEGRKKFAARADRP